MGRESPYGPDQLSQKRQLTKNALISYVNSHVGTVTSCIETKGGVLIQAPADKFSIHFGYFDHGGFVAPCIMGISNTGEMAGRGRSKDVVAQWEEVQSDMFSVYFANPVTNSHFWSSLRYHPISDSLWGVDRQTTPFPNR